MTSGRAGDSEADRKIQIAAYIDRLSDYPADIAAAACEAWPDTSDGKWWPSWNELKYLCDRLFTTRRVIAAAVRNAEMRSES